MMIRLVKGGTVDATSGKLVDIQYERNVLAFTRDKFRATMSS